LCWCAGAGVIWIAGCGDGAQEAFSEGELREMIGKRVARGPGVSVEQDWRGVVVDFGKIWAEADQ